MHDVEAPQPTIVHQDEQLLIVDKPAGLPTTAPTPTEPSLVRWVCDRFPDLRPHPTSRLDAQVSGLVTFSLTRGANRHLFEARRAGAYERVYIGITVSGTPIAGGEWSWPISIDPRNRSLRIAGSGRGRREALTRYEVVAQIPNATLLRLMPVTGRTHQLRVHAAKAGAPLFGDHSYRGERRKVLPDGSVITARRVMLHCALVSFPPLSGNERMQVLARVHRDMECVWLGLGGTLSDLQP